jgi:excisionase family DNA binding protein
LEIVVLQKDEIETLVRRAAELAVAGLREELERTRTPDLMTMSQICDYLQCHRSTIARHIKNGMPAERFGGDPRFRKPISIFGSEVNMIVILHLDNPQDQQFGKPTDLIRDG